MYCCPVWLVGQCAGQLKGQWKMFLFCAAIVLRWSTLVSQLIVCYSIWFSYHCPISCFNDSVPDVLLIVTASVNWYFVYTYFLSIIFFPFSLTTVLSFRCCCLVRCDVVTVQCIVCVMTNTGCMVLFFKLCKNVL